MSIKRELEKLKKRAEYYESIQQPDIEVPASVILSAITERWERHNGSLALDIGFDDEKNLEVQRFLERMKEPSEVNWNDLPHDDLRKMIHTKLRRMAASVEG